MTSICTQEVEEIDDSNQKTNELLNQIATGGDCTGYEQLIIDSDTQATGLSQIPNGNITSAVMQLEADSAVEAAVRYIEHGGTNPSQTLGMPLGNGGVIEIKGNNIRNITFISTEAGKTHKLNIQYYS